MNKKLSLTAQAHSIIQEFVSSGDVVIDATLGNGYDTLFLAKQVGKTGMIFGFDIQQQAIDATQTRLEADLLAENSKLFKRSHHEMQSSIPTEFHGKVKVIMFNLGYLPGSDKTIITQSSSTLIALKQSIDLLDEQGIITIAAYPGHPGGEIETREIKQWLNKLPAEHYRTQTIMSSDKDTAPRLYLIQKR